MRKFIILLTGLLAFQIAPSVFAGDLGINVILSGEVQPGVYGQVQIGNAPRPVVVYERPRVVTVDRRYVRAEPIYLHVPPNHARYWDRHCREYHACGRKVYFVRSVEYEPRYQREHRHDHDRDRRDDHRHYDDRKDRHDYRDHDDHRKH